MTKLFWNEQGAICCETHAPYPGSDTWRGQRWTKITFRDRAEIAVEQAKNPAVANVQLRCEVCHV